MERSVPGVVRIAHTRSGDSGADEAVVAEFNDQGVLVSWPRAMNMIDAWRLNEDRSVPNPMILRDEKGWLTLSDGNSLGASASSLAHSLERIEYRRAIHTGAQGIDYSHVNGMTSEIDGLARWAKRVPVTTRLLLGQDRDRLEGVTVEAKNLEPLVLGGPLNLELDTSYVHNPSPTDGVFTISTSLLVRTRSEDLVSWDIHQQTHRMIQDLMCLVYGRPCASEAVSVMREDDQERPPIDERRYWRDVYQPSFGRAVETGFSLRDRDEPLFFYDEVDTTKLAGWLSDYSYWSRPTWIAMTALFDRSLPVESKLLQVAVALEALGYAITKRESPDRKVSATYEALLGRVVGSLGHLPDEVIGKGGTEAGWCASFNKAYKGVKHADNPPTEPRVAWSKAREGLVLIRCWLASELGVPNEVVAKRLRDGRVSV